MCLVLNINKASVGAKIEVGFFSWHMFRMRFLLHRMNKAIKAWHMFRVRFLLHRMNKAIKALPISRTATDRRPPHTRPGWKSARPPYSVCLATGDSRKSNIPPSECNKPHYFTAVCLRFLHKACVSSSIDCALSMFFRSSSDWTEPSGNFDLTCRRPLHLIPLLSVLDEDLAVPGSDRSPEEQYALNLAVAIHVDTFRNVKVPNDGCFVFKHDGGLILEAFWIYRTLKWRLNCSGSVSTIVSHGQKSSGSHRLAKRVPAVLYFFSILFSSGPWRNIFHSLPVDWIPQSEGFPRARLQFPVNHHGISSEHCEFCPGLQVRLHFGAAKPIRLRRRHRLNPGSQV